VYAPMTRRHWFGSLLVTLAGAWSAARARPRRRPPAAAPAPPPPAPPEPDCPAFSYTSYVYDGSNRLVSICDQAGRLTTCVYDARGRPWGGWR